MFHTPAHKITPATAAAVFSVYGLVAKQSAEPKPDFNVCDAGSIVLLTPITTAAKAWCKEYLPEDCARHGRAYAIEARYICGIIDGLEDDGLILTNDRS